MFSDGLTVILKICYYSYSSVMLGIYESHRNVDEQNTESGKLSIQQENNY